MAQAKDTASKLKNWQPDPNITPEQLEEMRVEVYDRIVVARVGLLLRHPFFGNMATRLLFWQQMIGCRLPP
jgi:hypothetical protein